MKIIRIITINLLFFLILSFIGTEAFFIHKYEKQNFFEPEFSIQNYKNLIFHSIPVNEYFDKLYKREKIRGVITPFFRDDYNTESELKPVLFMGCSYTWGQSLNENETVSAQFAKLTKRPTYNRSGKGWGFSHLLYQLSNETIYKQIKEPEYIIYTFIGDHPYRLDTFKENPATLNFQPKYNFNSKNQLIEQKPTFIDSFLSVSNFQYNYGHRFRNDDYVNKITKIYLRSAKNETEKHNWNTKFVILKYPSGFDDKHLDSIIWKELEKEGFIILDARELTNIDLIDKRYKATDGWHPNAKAWELILPKLIKKLNIN